MAEDAATVAAERDALRRRIADLEDALDRERRRAQGCGAESLCRRLVALSPDAILVHDDNRRVVFVNDAGVRLFGADSAAQIMGRIGTGLVHPAARRRLAQAIARGLSQNAASSHPGLLWLRLDGSAFRADVSVAGIEWAGRPAALVTVRDIGERLRAEERSRAAEARSRTAHARLVESIELMSEGFALFDADDRLVICNRVYAETIWPQCADILKPGIRFEEILRTAARRGAVAESEGDREAVVAEALRRHRALPSEDEIRYPSGRWLRQSKRRTGDGGVVAVYADITEIKAREQALRESEARHRRLLETLPDAVIIHVDERMVFVNAAAVRLFGADSRERLLARSSLDLVPPEFVALQRARRRKVLEEHCSLPPAEQVRYRLDGSTVQVETVATFMLWGGRPAFVGVLRDITARKAAEAALAESERRFQAVTANMPGAVYQRVLAPDGSVSFPYISPGIRDLVGYEAADVIRDPGPLMDAIRPDFRAAYRRTLERSAAALAPFDLEIPFTNGDGRAMWVRSIARPHRGDAGTVVWDGLMFDITDRKQAEARALQAHRWLLEAVESMPDGVLLWDPDDRLVLWNERFAEYYPDPGRLRPGLGFEAVIALPHQAVRDTHGEEAARIWLEERCKSHARANGAHLFQGGGGRWFLVTERRTAEDFTVTVITDATAQKQNEARLRESEERYRKLVTLSPDAIYVHKAGRIVVCNQAAVTMFRAASQSDLIGKETLQFIHPDFRDDVRQRQQQVVASGTRTAYMRQKRLRLDGGEFWAQVAAAGIEWEGVRGGIVVIRDITDQIRAEDMLRRGKEAAELANRAKTEFLANISHELRTPLNAIIGFSDIMQREMLGPLGNARYRGYARDIHQSGSHLHEVINDILDLSKIEAGKLELHEEEVDMARAVRRCVRVVQPRAAEGGVRLTVDVAEPLPRLRADGRKIKQVLINLLSNAIKFTERGGAVTLSVAGRPDGGLAVSVADTGIGMTGDEISAALQPFGQVDSTLSRKYEGTGLGLPLTRSLVELHGGRFEIDSAPGEGTVVTVRFPPERALARSAAE